MDKLIIRNLSVNYGTLNVFHDLNLELKSGELNFILGANGCGKTTLLKCVCSLIDYQGEILYKNQELRKMKRKECAKEIAMISQISQVSFSYRLIDTVMMGRFAHKKDIFSMYSKEDEQIALDCLEKVGLLDEKDKLIHTCSGGQLQRVYIARLLAQNPKVILLDEMTNHLDFKYQIELLEFIRAWAKQENKIVLGVLHDLNLVSAFGDFLYLLDGGKIICEGVASEVLSSPHLSEAFGIDIKAWMKKNANYWEAL